ncbi:unnamed protein product [Gongylonema pulchrum]|uniref:ABC transmembrane type-1 domain-containing protein n=1 Tax=Gongylonema pulchrum TaxID=637853 RepID=A0A183CUP7_9BILA|nr:unnamed protein product [Gongylonema pulchrum]
MIYVLETIALISALIIVRPSLYLTAASAGVIVFAFIFYSIIGRIGTRMAEQAVMKQDRLLLSGNANSTSDQKNTSA